MAASVDVYPLVARQELDQLVALIDSPMISGDRLRGEERRARDLVPGELGHHRGRDAQ
jgi:hypothetical protein